MKESAAQKIEAEVLAKKIKHKEQHFSRISANQQIKNSKKNLKTNQLNRSYLIKVYRNKGLALYSVTKTHLQLINEVKDLLGI